MNGLEKEEIAEEDWPRSRCGDVLHEVVAIGAGIKQRRTMQGHSQTIPRGTQQ